MLPATRAEPEQPPSLGPLLERLLTIKEVATRLSVSRATAYKLCERGELPHLRVSNSIRVAVSDLEAFLQRNGRKE